jgi:flagellar biosynthesis GTPase FlhF
METHKIDSWLKTIAELKTKRILLRQNGKHLYLYNLDIKQTLRYNFKEAHLQAWNKRDSVWFNTVRPYKFFRGYELEDLVCPQTKLKVLIKYTKAVNSNCHSLATLFNRMDEVMIYENYIEQRIKHEKPTKYNAYWGGCELRKLAQPLRFYPKAFISLCKETGFKIERDTEGAFEGRHADFIKNVCDMLVNSDFYPDQKLQIMEKVVSNYETNVFVLKKRGYDLKTLFKNIFDIYVRNEGMTFDHAIDTLKDYYKMARIVKKHAEKYPKYLQSVHDIVSANFGVYQAELDRQERVERELREEEERIEREEISAAEKEIRRAALEKKCADMQKEWDVRKRDFLKYLGNSDFIITIPETPMALIQEGTDLSHCVASYVDDVKLGRTYIFFLRAKDKPFASNVTLEYKSGVITQARGEYNRKITWAEKDFLKEFCELKKLEFSKSIPDPEGNRPEVEIKKLTEWETPRCEEWFLKAIEKKAKEDAKEDVKEVIKEDDE